MEYNEPLPFKGRAKHLNESARRKGKPGRVSATDLVSVLLLYGEECFYCRKKLIFDSEEADGTFDHLLPLAKGGRNTKRNLVPCCYTCNHTKGERVVRYNNGNIHFVHP